MKFITLDKEKIFNDALNEFITTDCGFNDEPFYYIKSKDAKEKLFNSFKNEYTQSLCDIFDSLENSDWDIIFNFSLFKNYALHHFYSHKKNPSLYPVKMTCNSYEFEKKSNILIKNNIISTEDKLNIHLKQMENKYSNFCTTGFFNINYDACYEQIKNHIDIDLLSKQIFSGNLENLVDAAKKTKSALDEETYCLYYRFFFCLSGSISDNIPKDILDISEINVSY